MANSRATIALGVHRYTGVDFRWRLRIVFMSCSQWDALCFFHVFSLVALYVFMSCSQWDALCRRQKGRRLGGAGLQLPGDNHRWKEKNLTIFPVGKHLLCLAICQALLWTHFKPWTKREAAPTGAPTTFTVQDNHQTILR